MLYFITATLLAWLIPHLGNNNLTMTKKIFPYSEIKEKILQAVDIIADPVRQTLSPKGGNVIFQDDRGSPIQSNDGATIARAITVKDQVQDTIISIIKASSLKTNSEAGDGTTTSVLLSQVLIKQGFKLIEDGMNPIVLKKKLEDMGDKLIAKIKQSVLKVKSDEDLMNIATISANNDKDIAKYVVDVVKFAGQNGMIFIEPNNGVETVIEKEPGFNIKAGMFSPDLRNSPSSFTATYKKVPVFITDKRIYYREEAETILKEAIKAGHKSVVVVARDFIGEAPATFIANHSKKVINVLLVKDNSVTEQNSENLDDLALYLNGKVIKEKNGSLVNNITEEDFVIANQVYSDGEKTIFTPVTIGIKGVADLVKTLEKELEKDKDNNKIKERISALTSGTTTIKVGGATQLEQTEKIYRYEDAINATRAAMRDGYLVGGGVTLLNSYVKKQFDPELQPLVRRYTEASIRQIAENCGKHEDTVLETILNEKNDKFGYNALTDTYGNLLEQGVIDPYKVTEMAILNSISIANVILSSKFLIVNELVDEDK